MTNQNVDRNEIAKFEALASRWWYPSSEFKPLHDINPLRLNYIDERVSLAGKRALDVGCGGVVRVGVLSKGLGAANDTADEGAPLDATLERGVIVTGWRLLFVLTQ